MYMPYLYDLYIPGQFISLPVASLHYLACDNAYRATKVNGPHDAVPTQY